MLKELIDKNRIAFHDSFDTWEDAVRGCCGTLIADGSITEEYAEAIIENVNQYGPYIVITEDLAIPHTKVNARGVNSNGINFNKVRRQVEFEPGNPEKNATLIFTLAANDLDEHYENMEKLSEMLLNPAVLEALKRSDSIEDVKSISEEFNI